MCLVGEWAEYLWAVFLMIIYGMQDDSIEKLEAAKRAMADEMEEEKKSWQEKLSEKEAAVIQVCTFVFAMFACCY